MTINKNISDIITIQNSCKEIIQELYTYESRPSDEIRNTYNNSKLDEAIHFEIIEYNEFSDEFSLSVDTLEYYETRLGKNTQTNIGLVGDKLTQLGTELIFYNQRIKNYEPTNKEINSIHKILSQIPPLLKHNLRAITSNSIFAFKSESNFEIKMQKLKISKDEIDKLMKATYSCDKFLSEQYGFLKSMNNSRITSIILRFKTDSIALEKSFIKLFDDIQNFINKSIEDADFIKKIQKLKELNDNNQLLTNTNIRELFEKNKVISKSIKLKKIHSDNQINNYLETLKKIITLRETVLKDTRVNNALKYDINKIEELERKIYNYEELNRNFLLQDNNLLNFLIDIDINKNRLLGVFIRMLKKYSDKYELNVDKFIKYNNREYIEVKRCL